MHILEVPWWSSSITLKLCDKSLKASLMETTWAFWRRTFSQLFSPLSRAFETMDCVKPRRFKSSRIQYSYIQNCFLLFFSVALVYGPSSVSYSDVWGLGTGWLLFWRKNSNHIKLLKPWTLDCSPHHHVMRSAWCFVRLIRVGLILFWSIKQTS
jgi:hypothetical protein